MGEYLNENILNFFFCAKTCKTLSETEDNHPQNGILMSHLLVFTKLMMTSFGGSVEPGVAQSCVALTSSNIRVKYKAL